MALITVVQGGIHPQPLMKPSISATPERKVSRGNGTGYLAGTFPLGNTTVEGVPVSATVRVIYRPESGVLGDGILVAEVQSDATGAWLVENLDPTKKYDVVGRKGTYNDVIMSNISPETP